MEEGCERERVNARHFYRPIRESSENQSMRRKDKDYRIQGTDPFMFDGIVLLFLFLPSCWALAHIHLR